MSTPTVTALLVAKHLRTGELSPAAVPDFLVWHETNNGMDENTAFALTAAGEALAEELPRFMREHQGNGWQVLLGGERA